MAADLKLVADSAREYASVAEFTSAMSTLASGVVLVTCRVAGRPQGTTTTTFGPVSADPPTVLVSLGSKATSVDAIKATRRFAINVLADGQDRVARRGAAPGAPMFIDDLVVPGALAHLECELAESVEIADHTILLGRVLTASVLHEGEALVYHRRNYRTVSDSVITKEMSCLSTRQPEPISSEREKT
jgi:flavin reductase (DIM6/NTAB) family NADH-FMN oxidoreductase RutF